MSLSLQMYQRFERRKILRRTVSCIYIVLLFAYLIWRATIFNPNSIFLSSLFYAVDVIGFIIGLFVIISSWSHNYHRPLPAQRGLNVDVFVPTYKEPLHIIRQTVLAAVKIDYPHRTLVLDDAGREEVKQIAEEAGALYFARGKNIHAKAGNLNFGLTKSDAEYIVCFDADHIAQRQALDLLLGYFEDPKVAMVQTPQDYYNIDAIQYMSSRDNVNLWHDQTFFFNIVQPAFDTYDSSTCVGTGVAFRREALDEVGGFALETVTEDFHTSLRMHKKGWKSRYLNESIAFGVASADLEDYYKTRHRWTHGNLHVQKLENIVFCKDLDMGKRLSYLNMGVVYLEGWQKLLTFLVPVIALIFGLQPFIITPFNVCVVLLFPLLTFALFQEIGCGFSRLWTDEIFSMMRFPTHILGILGLFGRPTPWRTSTKKVSGSVNWRLLMPQISVAVISLVAIAIGVWRLYPDYKPGPLFTLMFLGLKQIFMFSGTDYTEVSKGLAEINFFSVLDEGYTLDLVLIAGFWAFYNTLKVLLLVNKAFKQAQSSSEHYLFPLAMPLKFGLGGCAQISAISHRLSVSSVWFTLCEEEGVSEEDLKSAMLDIYLPNKMLQCSLSDIVILDNKRYKIDTSGKKLIKANLNFSDERSKEQLAEILYSVNWHRNLMHHIGHFKTPLEVLGRLLCFKNPFRKDSPQVISGLVTHINGQPSQINYAAIKKYTDKQSSDQFISFQPLRKSDIVTLQVFSIDGLQSVPVTIESTVTDIDQSLVNKNLDGTIVEQYVVNAESVSKKAAFLREEAVTQANHR